MRNLLTRLDEYLLDFEKKQHPNDARKILECSCKLILKNANLTPEDEYKDKLAQGLIDFLTPEKTNISKGNLKKIKQEMNAINTYGSLDSHDNENLTTKEDTEKLKNSIDSLMNFIFNSDLIEIDHTLPENIFSKYKFSILDIENWRCDKIIKSVYPNRSFKILIENTGYQLYEINEPDGRSLYFLFLGRNVGFTHVFEDVVKKSTIKNVSSITILFPNEISTKTDLPVQNRKTFIESKSKEVFKKINNNIFIKCDFFENYIWDQCLPEEYKKPSNITTEENFIDQILFDENNNNIYSQELIKKIIKNNEIEKTNPIYLIIGSGGAGKTTFCEESIKEIDKLTIQGVRKKAILLSSFDLPEEIPNTQKISSIQDLFFLIKSENHDINNYSLELNISSGNFLIIVDGLDEIISKLKDKFDLKSFFESIILLNDTYLNCNLIITSRDLSYSLNDKSLNGVYKLELKGFNEELSERYFKKRFKLSQDINDLIRKSMSYLKKIEIKDNPTPLILTLIGDLISEGVEESIDQETKYFLNNQPLDLIVYQIIQRDIDKQHLNISVDSYFEIIRDILIEYNGKVNESQFKDIIDISIENEVDKKYSSLFVSPLLLKKDNYYYIKYDALELWFKARALFYYLNKKHSYNKEILGVLYTSNGFMGRDVVQDMDLSKIDSNNLKNNIKTIVEVLNKDEISENERKIISGLLYIYVKNINLKDKSDISDALKDVLIMDNLGKYSGLNIFGDFFPLDFENFMIKNGYFSEYTNLSNSKFPNPPKKVFFNSFFLKLDYKNFSQNIICDELFYDCHLDSSVKKILENDKSKQTNKIENIKYDLNKVLKCGYKDGGFSWKSLLVYKQQCNSLKTDWKLQRLLDHLVTMDLLIRENSKTSSDFGYLVNSEYSAEVKIFLTQKRVLKKVKEVINSMN